MFLEFNRNVLCIVLYRRHSLTSGIDCQFIFSVLMCMLAYSTLCGINSKVYFCKKKPNNKSKHRIKALSEA